MLRFPVVTYLLMAANICTYLLMLPYDPEFVKYGMGLVPENPSFSSIVSSMFLHTQFWHLAWNMLFLWLFGPNVEDALGRLEYTIFYFGSGFAAALLHIVITYVFTPEALGVPMLGASGAIAGILGVFAVRFYKTRIRLWYFVRFSIPAWIGLGIWFVQQVTLGIDGIIHPQSGGVAYWAHIGGMVFGMVLAMALRMGLEGTKEYLMTDARASLEQGTTWGATESLLWLLKCEPGNAEVHRELARTYDMQQNPDQAVIHYRKSIDLYLRRNYREEALRTYEQMRSHYPSARLSLRSEFQLARYMLDMGDPLSALPLLERIACSYAGTPEAEISLMKAGEVYMNTIGNPRMAVECHEQFLQQYPQSSYRGVVEKSLETARANLNR